jgi:hypothetical protein
VIPEMTLNQLNAEIDITYIEIIKVDGTKIEYDNY